MIKEEDISIHSWNSYDKAVWLFPNELKAELNFHGEHFYDNDDQGYEFSLGSSCRMDVTKDPMYEEDFVARFNHMLTYPQFKKGLFNYIFSEGWKI